MDFAVFMAELAAAVTALAAVGAIRPDVLGAGDVPDAWLAAPRPLTITGAAAGGGAAFGCSCGPDASSGGRMTAGCQRLIFSLRAKTFAEG